MLDVLRGVAVLSVFVRHLGDRFRPLVLAKLTGVVPDLATRWLGWALERTHWGVDLFFVLSGFTLGMGFVRDHRRGLPRRVADFFTRRAVRIIPAFYAALVVHLAFHSDLLRQPRLGEALACHAALLQGYWAPGLITIIGASWSLTTEAHFYVFAPPFARWLLGPTVDGGSSPRPLRRVLVIIASSCLAVWVLRGLLHDLALLPGSRLGMLELTQRRLVFCRLDQFLLGMGAAVAQGFLWPKGARARATMGFCLALAALLALALAVPLDAWTWSTRGGNPAYPLVSLGMTLLVLAATLLPDFLAKPLVVLRFLGIISYGVFLYHQLALELAHRWIPGAGGMSLSALAYTASAGLAFAIIGGAGSFYLIEAPALARVSRSLRKAPPPSSPSGYWTIAP